MVFDEVFKYEIIQIWGNAKENHIMPNIFCLIKVKCILPEKRLYFI